MGKQEYITVGTV